MKRIIPLILTLAILVGCGSNEPVSIDASSLESATKSIFLVFQDVAGELLQGNADLDTLNRTLQRLSGNSDISVSKVITLAKDFARDVPVLLQQEDDLMDLAKKLHGLTAEDILKMGSS